ncbi:MAG TPA: DUF3617 family protein [Stellaceae bacterium]|jgi:hypothetical protein|nr:DUF3617 family protein [Stellaceae bacterium]
MKFTDRLLLGIAVAAFAGGAALAADDALKPGRWEFVTEIHGPKAPAIPPGAKLPPGVQMRPDGSMSVTRTVCVSAQNPVPVGPPPTPPQGQGQPNCKLDKMERSGGDAHWAMTCNGPQGASHAEGEAHYRGDTMQASTQSHFTAPNQPAADMTERTSGRYLGTCTGNETRPGPAQPSRQAPRS